jgi:hypothetical protein
MRIQFKDKREAARFAAAVVNVTGREPSLTRTEDSVWRVHSAELNKEWAFAISSLLQSGVPSQHVTLDQVAARVQSVRWTTTPAGTDRAAATHRERLLAPGQMTAVRGMRQEAWAAAVG